MTHKIKIDDIVYEANTDFRVAIKCNEIAMDKTIGDYERVLAILYTMFGEDGLNNPEHYEKLLKWVLKYLSCGEEIEDTKEKPDMDYIEDEKYIKSSFKYDYKYNPYDMEYLSWEDFYNDLNNLSNSEFGNCCVLNRVRNLRNFDLKEIKDPKEREKMRKAKKAVELKKYKKEKVATEKQLKSAEQFYQMLGYSKE